jgi:transposase
MPRGFVPHNKHPDSLVQAVRAADREGSRSRKQIALDFGINESTIRAWFGARDKNNGRYAAYARRQRYADQVREMHWEGHTYVVIAKTLGLPTSTVWDYINRPYKEGT